MKRLIRHSLRTSTSFILAGIFAIAIVGYFMTVPQSAATLASFTVNSTVDAPDASPGDGMCADVSGNCTLRAAITESNFVGGANVITVPSGTYALTLGPFDDEFNAAGATMESGDLDIVDLSAFSLPTLTSVTINGAGAGVTIIDGGGIDRVLDINNFAAFGSAVNVTLQGLTIRNGNAPTSEGFNESGGGIQFDGFDNNTFLPTGTLTINNCNITSNTAAGQGGGLLAIFGSLMMNGSGVSGNTSVNAAGGGISYDGSAASGLRTLQITNGRISGNHANNGTFGNGGGVWEGGNANKTIDHSVIASNAAGAQGGGVFNGSGSLTMNFDVIVGNTASGNPASSGLRNNTGAINAENNWWGCNQGPTVSPCDSVSGAVGTIAAWLSLSHTASPSTILVNQSTTLQADFFTNNLNTGIAASDLVALNGRAVVFNNAVLGTISGADPTISGGKANATFTAGSTGGNGSTDATVDSATVTASILINQPASVVTNPTDQTVCDGGTVTFTASSSGFPTPTVQWQVSAGGGPFMDIPGATSTTLMFTATAADNGNQYRAVFTNSSGTATTTAATLTVDTAPAVTTNPVDTTVCDGATATFTAAASGSPAPIVQWQVSSGGPFSDIPGATSTTLMFTATTADNGKQYRAVFTNTCGTATTTVATLTVNASTSATTPADQTVCQGATASFSTTASGTGQFHYAWTVDGSPFGGDTSSINVPTGSLSVGTHPVSVTVSGTCGSVMKNATLTVQAPTATTDPADVSVCMGATASFSTTASGTGPFHYSWTLDGLPFNGDSAGINVPTGSLTAGAHTVAVTTTGACGSAAQSATLTVGGPPVITLSTNTVSMWPPNHDYHTFNVTDFVASASGCDGDLTSSVVIASVSSDEPEDNLLGADGTTLNDIVIAPDCKSVQLRSERDGNLNGRVYTITFRVRDSQGNTTTVTATVTIPVNQSGPAAVDDGPGAGYTVISACP